MGKKYDLTSPQKSIWYTEEVFKGTTVNNICTTGIIYEKINEDLLKQAINNVVKQNDSFRIHLTLENGIIKQYISDYEKFDIDVEFIDNASKLKEIEESEAKYLFNLIDSNLFKFRVVILKDKFAAVILTANHIISDSWSMGITIQEILRNYHCLLNNENPTIDTFSYLDYIASEEQYLNSKKYEADRDYWQKEFETIPEQATIPSLKIGSSSFSNIAKRSTFNIDKKIVTKINDFCKKYHFSVFAFFMGIYSIYISRVSNTDDFVIGTPILNRTNMKEKHTTGMFVNTAPVRINNFNSGAFCDFVNSISQKIMGVLRHQKYSYNRVIEDLRKENKNLANLYNIMISYQITKAFNKDFGNYKTNWTFNGAIGNDMNINIFDINNTGNLSISYDYSVNKYQEKDIKDMHLRILFMINQVLEHYNILEKDIEIVTKKEKNQILYDFNNTTMDYSKDKNILDLFEDQVEKNPDNVAVIFESQELTYRDLNKKANSLAFYLVNHGITNKDIVCISLNRSLELIIAIYAVIKSGATFVLVDKNLPEDRINYIIKNSGSKYSIVDKNSHCMTSNTINISSFDFEKNSSKKLVKISSDTLCIIYTSGSTGKPKGVLLNKLGFLNLVFAFDKEMNISLYKHILSIATISFDMFAVELFSSTLFGNTLVLANEEEQKNPILMSKLIKEKNVDFFVTTPSRVELLLLKECDNPLKNIKAFQLGGEKFYPSLYNKLLKFTNAKIFNGYGPTEITACCTNKLVTSDNVTIGKPIPNMHAYICDKNLNLLPVGFVGEICISGPRCF